MSAAPLMVMWGSNVMRTNVTSTAQAAAAPATA